MIQRQGAIRDNNVLTWREDSDGLICLCPSPPTAKENKQEEGRTEKEKEERKKK
jgi:hypothetical protein